MVEKSGILYSLIIAIFIGPLIEEFIFRWPLKDVRKRIYLSTILGVVFTFNKVFMLDFKTEKIILSLFIIILIVLLLYFWGASFLEKISVNSLSILSAVMFGLYHLSLIKEASNIIIVSTLFIIPKIILGLFLNKIRLRYGMLYNIILHVIINFIGSLSLLNKSIVDYL
ncbi:CPBP family glutamic-type intramembrane protease [Chryseobacterium paridis]|uniref:CPBP family intramembrane metalloprotease n=1 Tax=Chryseobacterium paridis TaxID=2800328 RepID=A0ABS1FYA2_9FLAO|nr:CPBP family intramembrane metalloprotease [Chryseobacterium paridis]